ncbi:MAG: QueT transporter family protein [Caldisericia bacterium]|nr:QueT transporter family protein [Caldisericia bacterium]
MKTKNLIRGSLIGAVYFALTVIFAPISFKAFQVRISEGLTLLPFLTKDAIWGLFIGCFIANFFSPFGLVDMIFGSLLTLFAAYLTYLLRKTKKLFLAPLPPILINGFGVSFYITLLSMERPSISSFPIKMYFSISLSIILGEALSTYIIGLPLTYYLSKLNFLKEESI